MKTKTGYRQQAKGNWSKILSPEARLQTPVTFYNAMKIYMIIMAL
jgi:hypothetical protein